MTEEQVCVYVCNVYFNQCIPIPTCMFFSVLSLLLYVCVSYVCIYVCVSYPGIEAFSDYKLVLTGAVLAYLESKHVVLFIC